MTELSESDGLTVAMARAETTPGIDIIDPIERRRCTILTDTPVNPEPANLEAFRFPVETAVAVETTGLYAPFTGHAYVRDADGEMLAKISTGSTREFPPGTYNLELTGLIKVYLRIDAALSIDNSVAGLSISFPQETAITIGSRSPHTKPATTITVTESPYDLLEAISTFGSALKTTSPERCFPTLRGHPPEIEIGEECSIPDELAPPITDLKIEVPPQYEYVYPIASLAYFLGVAAVPGPQPRLVGPNFDYSLSHPGGFELAVHELLQHLFFLECITRTEGLYPVKLYERERIEDRIDLPFESLYNESLAERVRQYIDIPVQLIGDILPDWRLSARVDPDSTSASMIPFLANDLALVSIAKPEVVQPEQVSSGLAGATRGARTAGVSGQSTFVKTSGGARTLDTAWVSDGTPIDATKAVPAAYRNRIGRRPRNDDIEISVVCNSADMAAELDSVNGVYGSHETMEFDVSYHESVSIHELTSLLQRDFDFFHYIGHIDESGFQCSDGRLDVRSLESVSPAAFFLNACQSYEQGLSMIEQGSIGGIVTLDDVVNYGAIRIGKTVAKLLNGGFPLRTALDIASNRSVIGNQYVVVGDGTLSIVEPPSGTPPAYHIERCGDQHTLRIDGYGAPPGMGCMYTPHIEDKGYTYLAEGRTREFRVSDDELHKFLQLENVPILSDSEISWSYDF